MKWLSTPRNLRMLGSAVGNESSALNASSVNNIVITREVIIDSVDDSIRSWHKLFANMDEENKKKWDNYYINAKER